MNRDLDFFLFSEIRDQNPPSPFFFFMFSSMEKVFKIHVDLNLQTFFSSIFICILGGICLSCLPLNCHYHQIIGFALKQFVPVSYYKHGDSVYRFCKSEIFITPERQLNAIMKITINIRFTIIMISV